MARFRMRSRGVARRKRQTKWCGEEFNFQVPSAPALVVGDGNALCVVTTAVVDQADPLVGWCRGQISLSRRASVDGSPAVAWAIVAQRLTVGAITPAQTFNPFFKGDLERQDILGMGHCVVPPIVLKADNTFDLNRGNSVTDINVRVSRRLARNTNNLFLWIASEEAGTPTDVTFHAIVTIRTLMKFG